jgi:hypothetical protein
MDASKTKAETQTAFSNITLSTKPSTTDTPSPRDSGLSKALNKTIPSDAEKTDSSTNHLELENKSNIDSKPAVTLPRDDYKVLTLQELITMERKPRKSKRVYIDVTGKQIYFY